MSELLQAIIGPIKIFFIIVVIIIVLLYLLSIVWVFRDARQRETNAFFWTIVAIIPVAGLVAYCLMRPPLSVVDADEQAMEMEFLHRKLNEGGSCPHCGHALEKNFLACPACGHQVRNLCSNCRHVLDREWRTCPYCMTPVGTPDRQGQAHRSSRRGTSSTTE